MINVVRILAFVLVPLAFIAILAFGMYATSPPTDLINKPGPEFTLPLLEGGSFGSRDLKGSPVMLNFWASWCVPCREEARLLQKSWTKYQNQGVKFVGVNVQDSTDDAAGFVREFGLTFPMVRDVNLDLYKKLGVRGMPETFFLDHTYRFAGIGSGRQIGQRGSTKVLGAIEAPVLDSQIQQLLEKARLDLRKRNKPG